MMVIGGFEPGVHVPLACEHRTSSYAFEQTTH